MATKRDRALEEKWRDVLRCHAQVSCALERALAPHRLGVSEFEVLDRLVEGGADSARIQEIGDEIHLSQSALSRVIGRLERDGFVSRSLCPEDRRSVSVCPTAEGRRRFAEALPDYHAVLADTLGARR
ncbi:MAG: MarR family winged helix-turn-helix transcriptional regulator [Mycobacteriales bacterium]